MIRNSMGRTQKKVAESIKSESVKAVKVTPFQQSVYDACKRVPAGHVTTYKHIANAIEKPSAYRAVGNALRRNPFAPIVPCHRVVASDRSLGGFFGATEGEYMDKKVKMLKDEAVTFDSDGKVSEKCIFDPAHT